MLLPFAGEERHEGEDSGVGGAAEGERGEGVGGPAEAAEDMACVDSYGEEGGVEGGAADGVVDDVEAGAGGVLLEILLDGGGAVVDGAGSKVNDGVTLFRGDGGEDFGSGGFCELDGDVPDAARSGVDEDGLAGVYFGAVDEAFPGGDGDKGKSRGFRHGEGLRLAGEEGGGDGDVFGERALVASHAADQAVDFVAGSEGGDAFSDGFDGASHVEAEDGGEGLPGMGGGAGADLGIERIDAGRVDFNEDVAGLRRVGGEGLELEVCAGLADDKGFHAGLLMSIVA